jgi:uncharacterized protein
VSQENMELARKAATSLQALIDRLDDDVVWDNTRFGGEIPMDHATVFVGKRAVTKSFRSWLGAWEEFRYEVEELIDAGDSVVIVVHESARGRASGASMEHRYSQVWTFSDGRIVSGATYERKQDALKAVGLI